MCQAQLDIYISTVIQIFYTYGICVVCQRFWRSQLWSHSLSLLDAPEIFHLKYPLHFWHNWSYSLHHNDLSGHYNAITPTKVPENPHNILFDTQSTSKLKELLFLLWECWTQIQNVVFTTYLWSDMCILPLELRAQRKYCYICSRGSALMIYLKLTQTHSKRFWEFIRALFVCEKKGDSKRLRTVIHCLLPKILESKDYFFFNQWRCKSKDNSVCSKPQSTGTTTGTVCSMHNIKSMFIFVTQYQ